MLKFDDRFARQDRYEPPPEFPLASPCSSIVHHLSGLSPTALAPRRLATSVPRAGAAPTPCDAGSHPFCFRCAVRVLGAAGLAAELNSLVRVSRRVGRSAGNHAARSLRTRDAAPDDRRDARRQTAGSLTPRPATASDDEPLGRGRVCGRRSSPAPPTVAPGL